jgi:hypothetical protein
MKLGKLGRDVDWRANAQGPRSPAARLTAAMVSWRAPALSHRRSANMLWRCDLAVRRGQRRGASRRPPAAGGAGCGLGRRASALPSATGWRPAQTGPERSKDGGGNGRGAARLCLSLQFCDGAARRRSNPTASAHWRAAHIASPAFSLRRTTRVGEQAQIRTTAAPIQCGRIGTSFRRGCRRRSP